MGLPLRILHVVVNMNRGGAETLIMNLYRNMDRSKIQFDFLTCKEGSFDAEIEKMGGKVHRIPYLTEVGHFQYTKALKNFFFHHPEYQVVHAHMDKMSGFVLKAAKHAGIPVRISHSHNTSSEGGVAAKAYKSYAGHFILPNASHLFACSSKASEWLYGDKADKAIILKNGIDCGEFKSSSGIRNRIRKEFLLNKDSFVIGHVGRFCHQKNHAFLIDIFHEILKLKSKSFLLLIGDGPLKADIEEKVMNMGLSDKVKFLGVRNDVHELLQSLDIMLFPSIHEGLPVSIIEAQAVGLPCMVSDAITGEIDMGAGLIQYGNVKGSPRIWAKKVLCTHREMEDKTDFIQKNGYDIKESAQWLQNFYVQFSEGTRQEGTG